MVSHGLPLAGKVVARERADWPEAVVAEFRDNEFNGRVGQYLLMQNEMARVWVIRLAPGERVAVHRHVLDYTWIALTDGSGRQHIHDGTTREVQYKRGDTRSFNFPKGKFLLHDLQNTGAEDLAFITVELMTGANAPLDIGAQGDAPPDNHSGTARTAA